MSLVLIVDSLNIIVEEKLERIVIIYSITTQSISLELYIQHTLGAVNEAHTIHSKRYCMVSTICVINVHSTNIPILSRVSIIWFYVHVACLRLILPEIIVGVDRKDSILQ